MNLKRSLLSGLLGLSITGAGIAAEADEQAALKVLASEAGLHEKARACQKLMVTGGPDAVPAMAALLSHEHLSDYARWALEAIEDPAAGEALRSALPKLKGRQLIGVVNSLGVRRDAKAATQLIALVRAPDRGAAEPALAALGLIASPEALKTIHAVLANGPDPLRVPAAHAALAAADHLAGQGDRAAAKKLRAAVAGASVPDYIRTAAKQPAAASAN